MLLLLASCGKGFKEDQEQKAETMQGHYKAKLVPLNQRIGQYQGWITFSIQENQFWARAKVYGKKSSSMFAQYVHVNGRCPGMSDDTNGDGYLDFSELFRITGPILIPLDANLRSQVKGMYEFPKMRPRQSFYYYSKATNFSWMMEDLRKDDLIHDDFMVKLRGDLDLNKRVVVVYGIDDSTMLPTSVRSYNGQPNQATLPVACGTIEDGDGDEPWN